MDDSQRQKIGSLLRLSPDWGEGGEQPISAMAAVLAETFLTQLPDELAKGFIPFPLYEGELNLQYMDADVMLSIECMPDGVYDCMVIGDTQKAVHADGIDLRQAIEFTQRWHPKAVKQQR